MSSSHFDVVAVGNAIMDVIAHVDESFITRHGIARGRMSLIDEARCEELYAALPKERVETSGGSAGNTIAGICSLGGRAAFLGKVADDKIGAAYVADMKRTGADFYGTPLIGGPATARSMIAVTSEGERSMNTYLGASTEFSAADVDGDAIARGEWLYLEGYLFDKPSAKTAFVRAAEAAELAHRKVALTLSDVFCVERHRDSFRQLIKSHVDLVLANEHEILALYQIDDFDEAMTKLRDDCQMAAVTRSALGSVVMAGSDTWLEKALPIELVVDATGAGDQFAAGFLYGLTHGLTPPRSAQLGHLCAREVIGHMGPRPEISLKELARGSGFLI
jgi:sugar/nucleoside kinase (ribokinase family)